MRKRKNKRKKKNNNRDPYVSQRAPISGILA
jgi:hypothetical protein